MKKPVVMLFFILVFILPGLALSEQQVVTTEKIDEGKATAPVTTKSNKKSVKKVEKKAAKENNKEENPGYSKSSFPDLCRSPNKPTWCPQ